MTNQETTTIIRTIADLTVFPEFTVGNAARLVMALQKRFTDHDWIRESIEVMHAYFTQHDDPRGQQFSDCLARLKADVVRTVIDYQNETGDE